MQNINYLSSDDILLIHLLQVDLSFRHGELTSYPTLDPTSMHRLESAVGRPKQTLYDPVSNSWHDAYPTIFDKAAALMHSLINNHPFVDGNKRTGTAAAFIFLERNGFSVRASAEEVVGLALDVVDPMVKLGIEDIAAWLQENSLAQ